MDLEVHLKKYTMVEITLSNFTTKFSILLLQEATDSELLHSILTDLAYTVMKQYFNHVSHHNILLVQQLATLSKPALQLHGFLQLTMVDVQLHSTNCLETTVMAVMLTSKLILTKFNLEQSSIHTM